MPCRFFFATLDYTLPPALRLYDDIFATPAPANTRHTRSIDYAPPPCHAIIFAASHVDFDADAYARFLPHYARCRRAADYYYVTPLRFC